MWKRANLVIIQKPGKKDLEDPKSYRPVSLLPTLGKALETIIIQDLIEETGLDNIGEQHSFVPGRSTITAINKVYDWTNDSRCRHIFGAFLDITGAFDNVGWYPMLSRLAEIGASTRTLSIVKDYLVGRTVELLLEGKRYGRTLQKGCPQGSQLGPTLWKLAITGLAKIKLERTALMVTYADDIAVLVGAARPPTAFAKMEFYLGQIDEWAVGFGLKFSPTKSQLLSI